MLFHFLLQLHHLGSHRVGGGQRVRAGQLKDAQRGIGQPVQLAIHAVIARRQFNARNVPQISDLPVVAAFDDDLTKLLLVDQASLGVDGELEGEVKEESEEVAEPATPADTLSESSDPVRLYLKEMGNFQLLSREQEVEIAKRIEAGRHEVEGEVLRSPVTLDLVIEMGARVEAGEADLRDIFEENEEPTDADEERGPEGNEKQLKKLSTATTKLKSLHLRIVPGPVARSAPLPVPELG